MQTVILAGGLGTRLGPLLGDRPKPMVPVQGKPFLEYQLIALKRGGSSRLVLCVSYGSRWIQDYFGDGSSRGLEIRYSEDPARLGTAGALKYAEPLLDDLFQVMNGDTYLEIDFARFQERHRETKSAATLAITPTTDPQPYGNVALNSDGKIISFSEKPHAMAEDRYWVSAGLYIFERCLLEYVPAGRPVSLEKETFPLLLARGERLFSFPVSGYFIDIGTPDSLNRFEQDIREGRVHVDSQ